MKYDYLLAFGDSTTAGCELIPDSTDWEEAKKLSFPNQLANKLNIPCINFAMPGGSNDRSLRLLPEALLKYPNSLVLFTYTMFDRTEFFTADDSIPQDDTGYTGVGITWKSVKSNNKHQNLNNLYLKYFYNNTNDYNRYKSYNMLLMVQLLCKQYAKHFLEIFLYDQLLLTPDYQALVYEQIDKSHIFSFDYARVDSDWQTNNEAHGSLQQWAKRSNYDFCPGGHIGQQAHDTFAIELYNHLCMA